MLSDKEKQEIRENFKKKALNDEIDDLSFTELLDESCDYFLSIIEEKIKEKLEVVEKEVEGLPVSSGIPAIAETSEYANGWNDCRKEAYSKKQSHTKDVLKLITKAKGELDNK